MLFLKKNILFRVSFGVPFLFLSLLVSLGITQPAFADEKVIGETNCTNSVAASGWGGICQTRAFPWADGCTGGRQYVGLCDSGANEGCCIPVGDQIPASPPAKIETTLLSDDSCQASHGTCKIRATPSSDGCDNATENFIGFCAHWYGSNADGCCVPKAPASITATAPSSPSSPDCTVIPKPASCIGTPAPGNPTTIPFDNPLKFDTVEGVLGSLLGALRGIIVVLALIAIVIGAILYITSAGNDSRMTLAKGAITAAMIGLAIGIAAPSFLLQIGDILGWGPVTSSLPPETRTLTAIALSVLQFLLSIVGTLAIIMLVVGGIMYMTAAGNEDRIDTGKKIVLYSIIGIAVALAALVIVTQIAVLFA